MSDTSIRIKNASLDETELRGGTIIVRGTVAKESLPFLKYDIYQRELAPPNKRKAIVRALKNQEPLPNIELGMRGQKFTSTKDGSVLLKDPVYVIDGRQRIGTVLEHLTSFPDTPISMGAMVHFDTDREWEAKRFTELQLSQRKMSPQIILRNEKEHNIGIAALYGLSTNDKNFPLYGKISWAQDMLREEILTARIFAMTIAALHAHRVTSRGLHMRELIPSLEKIAETFGIGVMRDNAKTFFQVVDEAWGLRYVRYRGANPQTKGAFLFALAQVFSDHYDFWDENGKRLIVSADMRRRLKGLDVNDPSIAHLAGAGSMARTQLKFHILEALNKGKHYKLKPRQIVAAVHVQPTEEELELA